MRRFLLLLIVLLLSAPAFADTVTYSFSFVSFDDLLHARGTLTGDLASPGQYLLTSGDIYVTGAPAGLNGSGNLVSPPPYVFQSGGGTQLIGLDNILMPESDPQLTADGGLAFRMSSGLGIGIWANGPDNYSVFGGNWSVYKPGTFSAAPVPEPNSMVLLGTSLIGIAGFLARRRKSKNTA